jgi:hypothetical protein
MRQIETLTFAFILKAAGVCLSFKIDVNWPVQQLFWNCRKTQIFFKICWHVLCRIQETRKKVPKVPIESSGIVRSATCMDHKNILFSFKKKLVAYTLQSIWEVASDHAKLKVVAINTSENSFSTCKKWQEEKEKVKFRRRNGIKVVWSLCVVVVFNFLTIPNHFQLVYLLI